MEANVRATTSWTSDGEVGVETLLPVDETVFISGSVGSGDGLHRESRSSSLSSVFLVETLGGDVEDGGGVECTAVDANFPAESDEDLTRRCVRMEVAVGHPTADAVLPMRWIP